MAFISDLHGNIHALTAVKRFLMQQDLDKIVVVGDLVGYGASPGPVIDFVQREGWTVTMGSSDLRVALEIGEVPQRGGLSQKVLDWTKTVLLPEQIEYLRGLPAGGRLKTEFGTIRFFHGSPHNPEERINLLASDRELQEIANKLNARVIVAAGTHVPFMRTVGETTFIDSGSVGLSLNQEPGADLVIVELGHRVKVNMHKIAYDYASASFDILAWDLPPEIADVIKTGRMG